MNGMAQNTHPAMCSSRLAKRLFRCVGLGLMLASNAFATNLLYQNDAVLTYNVPPDPLPTIDALNFVNNNAFTINFASFALNTEFYEPRSVINYVNNDALTINTGFQFDTLTGSNIHQMAGSFNNSGTISCASFANQTGIFFINTLGVISSVFAGQLIVSATNIVDPGTVVVGQGGLVKFTGQNVDLTRTTMTMEAFGLFDPFTGTAFGNLGVSGITSAVGNNTNGWFPSIDLTATSAVGSSPIFLDLTNSTSYFDVAGVGTSNVIIRAVFIQNTSPDVTANVYFGANNIGPGAATIEFTGQYVDASSGQTMTNYLYLNNDYLLGASTNVVVINGVPDNFTFFPTTTQIALGPPTASSFPTGIFQPFGGVVTNSYSYVDAELISSTVATNASESNPSGALTNLPGRIQITANQELSLERALISGANYLSINAPNQFNGSAGALITAPYADINVGVTNGFLTVSNILEGSIPNWSGNIQAWSATWIYTDANGVTNDYRVLLVGSQIAPVTPAYVQDLILHGTNSVVISDTFNIIRSLSIDSQNLTLTTNGPGNGATSLGGELNLMSPIIVYQSVLPNLRNLTNNGAIRTLNLAQFYGTSNVVTATSGTAAVAATNKLSELKGTNVVKGSKVTIGYTYTFTSKLTNALANQIKIGTNFDATMKNLTAAINRTVGAGTNYSTNTVINPYVTAGILATAGALTNHLFIVTAKTPGVAANAIITTTTSTNIGWAYTTLVGGAEAVSGTTNVSPVVTAYDNFLNNGLISDQGSKVIAKYFLNTAIITNGGGNFDLQSLTTILTNGAVFAGGDVSIATGSLLSSNLMLRAGKSLTLSATNLLTDTGVTNGNIWLVGGGSGVGFNLPIKPVAGDLLGTTITNVAPTNKIVVNTWAAKDFGTSAAGYTNNAAIGRLILDGLGASPQNGIFRFNGTGTNNAIYVDYLELRDQATNFGSGTVLSLSFNTNLVIYYAQAVASGVSVAEKLNGFNSNHLRWVSKYAGYYSSTNIGYPNGTTNTINSALATSSSLDSDGDGIVNAFDPTPVFVGSQINAALMLTNVPPLKVRLTWSSIPSSTNYVYFTTNLTTANWLPIRTNVSASAVPPVGGWPITNTVDYLISSNQTGFYRLRVDPAN